MPLANPDNLARNALPSKEQTVSLPTERVSSTIPKGGTDGETWTYPSPQMFWNSLARKGKLGDTKEEDMETVVCLCVCI
jgi:cytochrome c heme-lyase